MFIFHRITDAAGGSSSATMVAVMVRAAAACTALFAAALTGCQSSVGVETKIPPLPTGSKSYVANVVFTGPSAQVDAGARDTPAVGSGVLVYGAKCASCHGKNGDAIKDHDLSDPVFCWTLTPQEFFKDLLDSPEHVNAQVNVLDRQELWNSVFYVWTLHSKTEDVVTGGLTFGKYCSVCHGTKGLGDGNLSVDLNPTPRRFTDFAWMVDKTDQRLYVSISDGRPPSAMPAWKALLSPTQRIQIINYLRAFTYKYPENLQKRMAEVPPEG
jgi:mono/diheme cytochrome c family protein